MAGADCGTRGCSCAGRVVAVNVRVVVWVRAVWHRTEPPGQVLAPCLQCLQPWLDQRRRDRLTALAPMERAAALSVDGSGERLNGNVRRH